MTKFILTISAAFAILGAQKLNVSFAPEVERGGKNTKTACPALCGLDALPGLPRSTHKGRAFHLEVERHMENHDAEAVALYRTPDSLTIELTGRAAENFSRAETALAGRMSIEDIFARAAIADLWLLGEQTGAAEFVMAVMGRA